MQLETAAKTVKEAKPGSLHPHGARVRTALVCGLILSFVIELIFWASFLLSPLATKMDFRPFYVAGYMVRTGHAHQLYDREVQRSFQNSLIAPEQGVNIFDHLPYGTLWFVPVSFLPYKWAYFAWLVVNILLLALAFRCLRPWIQPTLGDPWLAPAMFLLFLPVQVALLQGQDSILLLLLLSAAFILLSRDREYAAGATAALGMFKFQILMPIALLFLLKRRFKFTIAFAGASIPLAILSVYMVGLGQMKLYGHLLTHMSLDSGPSGSLRDGVVPSDMATLRALVSVLGSAHLNARIIEIVAVTLSGLLVLAVASYAPKRLDSTKLFPIFILTAVLAGFHVQTHDMTVALIPILLVLGNADALARSPWLVFSGALMFLVPLMKFVAPHLFCLVSLLLLEFLAVLIFTARNSVSLQREIPE